MSALRFRKRGKTWEYSFEMAKADGKRNPFSRGGFKTKAAASEAGIKAMNAYQNCGNLQKYTKMSYSDYLDIWMRLYVKINCKPSTYANYEKKIRLHIKPAIGKYELATLSPEAIQKLINDKFNDGYSRNSIMVMKGIITNSLSYAVHPLKYLLSSPAQYVKLPSTRAIPAVKTRTDPHVYLTPEQMQSILNRFPESTSSYLPLLLGYKCGLRLGEAFGLTWDCIDLDAKTLTVEKQILWHEKNKLTGTAGFWYFTAPKYNSTRTIELSTDVIDALQHEKERQEKAPAIYKDLYTHNYRDEHDRLNTVGDGQEVKLVMVRLDGTYINSRNMQYVSQVAMHKLGFAKFDYHSLRHTHATILAEKGASPKYVQYRLGHKNIQVTMQIYQHLTEKMSEDGVNLLNTF